MIKPEHVVPEGSLVAIGGSEDKTDDLDILRTICNLPSGGSNNVEIIPTASRIPEEAAGQYIEPFQKLGCENVNIMPIDNRDDAGREDYVQRIIDSDVVFFTGGDQLRLTTLLGGSDVLNALKGHYQRGGVIAGTSAGAAAMSQAMIYQGRAGHAMRKGTVQMTPGIGFIRNVVLDSHFSQRGRFNRLLEVVTGNPGVIGLGLDEDSGVIVREGNRIEAIGSGVVVVVDGHEMKYTNITDVRMGTAVAEEGVLVHTLTAGHGYHLEDRQYLRVERVIQDDHEDATLP